MQYVVNAIDGASGTFAKIALSAEDLSKRVDDLAKKRADIPVNVEDKAAQASLKDLDLKLTKLKMKVTDPEVTVKGLESAYFGIGRLDVALDRIGAKHVTATVDVDTRGGLLRRIFGGGAGGGGLLGGLAGGAASAGSGVASLVGGGGGDITSAIKGGGLALAGATAAALAPAAIPTLAGAGIGGLGLFLTQAKGLKTVMADVVATLKTAAAPLKGAFGDILKDFDKFIKSQGPGLRDMFKASLPFLNVFVKALEQLGKALLPVVTASLRQMRPYLPLISQGFVAVIQGLADMIKAIGPRGMQASAMLFVDLCRIMGVALTVFGKVLNFLAVTVQYTVHAIHQEWDDLRHLTADAFDQIRHDIAAIWDAIWRNTVTRVQNGVAAVVAAERALIGRIGGVLTTLRNAIAGAWDTIWRNTVTRVQNGITSVVGWFRGMPGRVVNALTGLGHTLGSFAAAALNEMWNGFKRIGGNILGWFSGFAKSVISVVKKVLGVFSPSSVFFDIGVNLMRGLENGVKHGVGAAQAAAAAAAHRVANVGSGVQRWAPLVRQALRMEGLSPGLLRNVLYQMSTESGGNPNAINRTDINAQRGDPSRGLMQVIGSTFSAYHWPGTSRNIYNPLANIAAALNYARHVYGPSLMSGGMGIGSGHGYDRGGWLMPGVTMAVNATGSPELVTPSTGPGSMAEVTALLRQLVAVTRAAPSRSAAGFARELNGAATRALR